MVKSKRISPTQSLLNSVVRNRKIVVDYRKLPTSFRVPYSVSLDVSVRDLLTTLHREFKINVSREIEPLIKKWAARTARKINENRI
jgi:post-segregation antitoxin (ccd killing protein)